MNLDHSTWGLTFRRLDQWNYKIARQNMALCALGSVKNAMCEKNRALPGISGCFISKRVCTFFEKKLFATSLEK